MFPQAVHRGDEFWTGPKDEDKLVEGTHCLVGCDLNGCFEFGEKPRVAHICGVSTLVWACWEKKKAPEEGLFRVDGTIS